LTRKPPKTNPNADQPPQDLDGYEIVVCVCGGISAYKVCAVVSSLVQRGAGVTVAMTRSARKFVGPVSFQALTCRAVFLSLWQGVARHDPQHIRLSESADLFLIAPATANMIGKIAAGIADDLVSTLVLSASGPVLLAPAMNTRMWNNPIVQRNVNTLKELGYHFVGPESGWLACRQVGAGRMAEPQAIVQRIEALLAGQPPKNRMQSS